MVGVLALQGGFEAHQNALSSLGVSSIQIKTVGDLSKVDRIIMPGGESSTYLKLMSEEFRETLSKKLLSGIPCLATCAGCILLSNQVSNPEQDSLKLVDIGVIRNGYGRQNESFIDKKVALNPAGIAKLGEKAHISDIDIPQYIDGVFIRAPKISEVGQGVSVLAQRENGEVVMVYKDNFLLATFHPELDNEKESLIHKLFLKL